MLVTVDDGVFGWPLLPTLNLMSTQIIVMLIARITAITTSPISDVRRGISIILPNEVYVGGMLVGVCTEVLVIVVGTTTDAVSAGILTIVVILHSSMKS